VRLKSAIHASTIEPENATVAARIVDLCGALMIRLGGQHERESGHGFSQSAELSLFAHSQERAERDSMPGRGSSVWKTTSRKLSGRPAKSAWRRIVV
jgi:hypothetical protein